MLIATIALLLLSWQAAAQTTSVSIEAIQPCTMQFTLDAATSKKVLSSCTYFIPGANTTAQDWTTCWMWCCPGLVKPQGNTLDDVQSCVSAYSQQPFMVTLIGIIIGIVLFFIFVCIPFLCAKDGPYQIIKKMCLNSDEHNDSQIVGEASNPLAIHHHSSNPYQIKNGDPHASQQILQEQPIRVSLGEELIDDTPSQQRTCLICGQGKANLSLNCKHAFHSHCLPRQGRIQKCTECFSENILPAMGFCCICERRYGFLSHIEASHSYVCRTCQER